MRDGTPTDNFSPVIGSKATATFTSTQTGKAESLTMKGKWADSSADIIDEAQNSKSSPGAPTKPTPTKPTPSKTKAPLSSPSFTPSDSLSHKRIALIVPF
jgi:hypothetical protein